MARSTTTILKRATSQVTLKIKSCVLFRQLMKIVWKEKLSKAIREYQSGEDKLDGREDKFDKLLQKLT